jgi:hypothetical protein
MPRIDPAILAWVTPLWIAAGAAALLAVMVCALAFGRARKGAPAVFGRMLLVVLSGGLCGVLAWALLANGAARDRAAERQALQARAAQLSAQALRPGSPLACIDAAIGDTIETACTRALFASPNYVAVAIAYVAAQFALLSDMTAYADRGGKNIDATLEPLRRSLEADPFGILAHVLSTRDGCTADKCAPLRLLHDASHVRTNLIAQTLDHYVDQYREAWAKLPDGQYAELPDAQPVGSIEPNATGKRKVTVNIDFPNADSIPPISIMNPEPGGPAEPHGAGANSEPRKRAEKPSAHEVRQSGAAGSEPVKTDPVWTPAPAQTH